MKKASISKRHALAYKHTVLKLSGDAQNGAVYIQWNLGADKWLNISSIINKNHLIPPFASELTDWLTMINCSVEPPSNKLKSIFYQSTHWKMLLVGSRGSGMFNHQVNS